jgi:hypothetical protein
MDEAWYSGISVLDYLAEEKNREEISGVFKIQTTVEFEWIRKVHGVFQNCYFFGFFLLLYLRNVVNFFSFGFLENFIPKFRSGGLRKL